MKKKSNQEVKISVSSNGKDFKEIDLQKMQELATSRVIEKMTSENGQRHIQRIIKKASIVDGLSLNAEYSEHITMVSDDQLKRKDIGAGIMRKGDNAIHDDLRNAFTNLDVHFALISELLADNKNDLRYKREVLKPFIVTGFTESGDGIVLIGQKKLSTGKVLNLITPHEKWDGEYAYISELGEAIEQCKHEVLLYLDGKMASPSQKELFEEEATKQEETAPQE